MRIQRIALSHYSSYLLGDLKMDFAIYNTEQMAIVISVIPLKMSIIRNLLLVKLERHFIIMF